MARFAGCMLGAPVENYSIEQMQEIAKKSNTPFPPTQYWNDVTDEEGDDVTKDIFVGAKAELEKNIWMLTAEIGQTPGL